MVHVSERWLVRSYLRDARVHECRISDEEEKTLSLQMWNGDREARDRLLRNYLAFVIGIALRYEGRRLSTADLIQEGNVGMLKAAHNFDPRKSAKFGTYAYTYIRAEMRDALRSHDGLVNLCTKVQKDMEDWETSENRLYVETGNVPEDEEILSYMHTKLFREKRHGKKPLSKNRIALVRHGIRARSKEKYGVSLDEERGDERVCDSVAASRGDDMSKQYNLKTLPFLLRGALGYRDAYIVLRKFYHDASNREIGEEFNISPQAVDQIVKRSLTWLREVMRIRGLTFEDFL